MAKPGPKAKKRRAKPKRLRAYTRRKDVLKLDARTRAGRFAAETRTALTRMVCDRDGQVSAAQGILIEATVILYTRFMLLAERFVDVEYGTSTWQQWLAINNGLRKNLQMLGVAQLQVGQERASYQRLGTGHGVIDAIDLDHPEKYTDAELFDYYRSIVNG